MTKKTEVGFRRYSKALKRRVASDYLSGKFSHSVGAELYGLRDGSVVSSFVSWYKKNGYFEGMEEFKADLSSEEQSKISDLEAELSAARLKIASLEAMIDVAEQELSVSIRKKFGTKQSK